MSQPTERYKRSFTGSVGSGMKSVFGGEGRRYYVLEHKVSTKYHKAGESQRIIVDQIELGRDPKCQVRFDEMFGTVSRRHAAIVKDGDNWKLVQLSKTNSTYLNGQRIGKEWYLQNGDEIQLSTNGPKLGFIVPGGEKGLVKSIGMTARLNLFRQQALRPYKQALTVLAVLFVLGIGGLTTWNIVQKRENDNKIKEIIANEKKQAEEYEKMIAALVTANQVTKAELDRVNKEITQQVERLKKSVKHSVVNIDGSVVNNDAIAKCLPYIFYIQSEKVTVTFNGRTKDVNTGWTGTGFVLNDGRIITARHVVEPWYFVINGGKVDSTMLSLNKIACSGKGSITAHFKAYSSDGTSLSFTNENFNCDRSHDRQGNYEDGTKGRIAKIDETDWAYAKLQNFDRGLAWDNDKSENLKVGTKLTVLGFPLGLGADSPTNIRPIYGSGIVACDNLNNGRILTTDTNYEEGNSGGPVFYTNESGNLVVVGLVSAGAGRVTGFVLPISVVPEY